MLVKQEVKNSEVTILIKYLFEKNIDMMVLIIKINIPQKIVPGN